MMTTELRSPHHRLLAEIAAHDEITRAGLAGHRRG